MHRRQRAHVFFGAYTLAFKCVPMFGIVTKSYRKPYVFLALWATGSTIGELNLLLLLDMLLSMLLGILLMVILLMLLVDMLLVMLLDIYICLYLYL